MRGKLQLWGGPECTINRVDDAFVSQLERCGHLQRLEDIELFASLGIRTLRYPILWEQLAPEHPDECDWRWIDQRLYRLRELGIKVIAGLVHHGSGPAYTDLLDDDGFARGLAEHARRVAERFPWIDRYTPVNEPLTTARFSALYGHWYPHARDEGTFWRALLNQIDGIRLSMAAIRAINPAAKLIQTDDLGRTYATAELQRQASFDNLRRWAGWDLLCGRVTPEHPLRDHIASFGLASRLEAIAASPCPPDVIGVNHYLTSDRFLDHRVKCYPPHVCGGNGRVRYADVEAIRALEPPPQGLLGALREAWHRYTIPIAVTEIHNGCTREEQMRWIVQAWDGAERLRGEGVDIQAITIWSLLGSCGWNTLLTGSTTYEAGVFDVSSGTPRPTALAELVRGLPREGARHPASAGDGWWHRPIRLTHPVVHCTCRSGESGMGGDATPAPPPILIIGATGTLGQAFARGCAHRNLPHVLVGRSKLDLLDSGSVGRTLDRYKPWAVINAAGWVRVDDAEDAPEECLAVNATGAIHLSRAASERGIPTLNFSSDLVFDGASGRPYLEIDAPSPLGAYGRSKAQMEEGVAMLTGCHLVIRTAAFFSPFDQHNFAVAVATALERGERFRAPANQVVSPTYVPHLVSNALDLLIDGEAGLWHMTNGTATSWAEFASLIAKELGLACELIALVAGDLDARALRPQFVPLATSRGAHLPPLATGIAEFAAEYVRASDAARLRAARPCRAVV
jgi:dTDP-4-dehydrorhamnose reductase